MVVSGRLRWKLAFWTQAACQQRGRGKCPAQDPSVQPIASPLTSPSPRQVKQLQQAPWRPPFYTVLSPAGIGLSSPPKGTRGWRPPLSDETPAQGSLSLMKGSLCSTGRPLAKDKTAVCPLSLVWGWGPPLRLADGWGWVQVHSGLPLFPCLLAQSAPPPSPLPTQGHLALAYESPGLSQPCCYLGGSELPGSGGIQVDVGMTPGILKKDSAGPGNLVLWACSVSS